MKQRGLIGGFLLIGPPPSRASFAPTDPGYVIELVGAELAREEASEFGENLRKSRHRPSRRRTPSFSRGPATEILLFKRCCLKDTSRHVSQATHPCAIAYSYARIGRLVRFGGGFYCGPVADESAIGFSDSNSSQRCIGVPGFVADLYFRDFVMVAVCGRPSGLPGAFVRFANLRTAATPPV